MKRVILLLWAVFSIFGCAVKPPLTDAERVAILRHASIVAVDLKKSSTATGHIDTSVALYEVKILKENFSENAGNATDVAAHFLVGYIEQHIIFERKRSHEAFDKVIAADCLDNLDLVLEFNQNIKEWDVNIADVNYMAGNMAALPDGPNDRARAYWDSCAQMGHPGCLNILANDLIKKPDLNDQDIRRAIELHATVVKTGIYANCAGLFSAQSIAEIIHFTGVKRPGDNDLEWVDEAKALRRQLESRYGSSDACGGAGIGVDEFMMRLDRGERREELLDGVILDAAKPFTREIARYLKGTINDATIATEAVSSSEQCEEHFYGAWRAKQNSDLSALRSHYEAMTKFSSQDCGVNRAFVRKMMNSAWPNS